MHARMEDQLGMLDRLIFDNADAADGFDVRRCQLQFLLQLPLDRAKHIDQILLFQRASERMNAVRIVRDRVISPAIQQPSIARQISKGTGYWAAGQYRHL